MPSDVPSPETLLDWIRRDGRLSRAADIRPAVLAPLLSHLLAHPSYYDTVRALLQLHLLRCTLDWATQHCQFYRTQAFPSGVELTSEAWADYPTIDRSIAESRREALIAENTRFGFMSFTSGTTRSTPLLIERSVEEQIFLRDIFNLLLLPVRAAHVEAPLGIAFAQTVHGAVLQLPSHGYSFVVDDFVLAEWLLGREFSIRGHQSYISSISGNIGQLYRLYLFLQERGFQPHHNQIKVVTGTGMPLPLHCLRKMEVFFGGKVKDYYSMAEVFGPAEYCNDCNAFHFSPYVIDEVLPVAGSQRPIDEGTGEMTLTPLFPFTQRFMLVRYRTGDLVSVTRVKCRRGSRAYRFHGRLKCSVCLDPVRQLYLGIADIAKALDEIPQLYRERSRARDVFEWPRFTLGTRRQGLGVHIAVEVLSEQLPNGDDMPITSQVRHLVLNSVSPGVREWLSRDLNRLEVTTHKPLTLVQTADQFL